MAAGEGLSTHGQSRRKRLLLTALLAAGSLVFAALGLWQIERRTAKLALIAAVEQRLHRPPVAAPGPPDWPRISASGDAYRPVVARGVFLHDRETLVQAVTELGPGYWVMTPLRTDAGWTLLVNRGFVPAETRERGARRAGEPSGVTVSGLLRVAEPGGGFLHSNDPPRDRWYSRDVAAIAGARHLGAVAPYFIDAGASRSDARQPRGGLTIVSFPNNHLHYALTWFALAALSGLGLFRTWRVGR